MQQLDDGVIATPEMERKISFEQDNPINKKFEYG